MLCDHEFFLVWVDEAMEELEMLVDKLEVDNPELDIIHSQMVIVNSKMLTAFMRNGNEGIFISNRTNAKFDAQSSKQTKCFCNVIFAVKKQVA